MCVCRILSTRIALTAWCETTTDAADNSTLSKTVTGFLAHATE